MAPVTSASHVNVAAGPRNVSVIARQRTADVRARLLEVRSSFAKQSAPCRPDGAVSIENREIEEATIRRAERQVSASLLEIGQIDPMTRYNATLHLDRDWYEFAFDVRETLVDGDDDSERVQKAHQPRG
jgi:hypothetical protein